MSHGHGAYSQNIKLERRRSDDDDVVRLLLPVPCIVLLLLLLLADEEDVVVEEEVVDEEDLPESSLLQLMLRLNDIAVLIGLWVLLFSSLMELPSSFSAEAASAVLAAFISSLPPIILSNLATLSFGLYLQPKLSGTPLDTDGLSPNVTSYSRTFKCENDTFLLLRVSCLNSSFFLSLLVIIADAYPRCNNSCDELLLLRQDLRDRLLLRICVSAADTENC